MKPQSGPGMIDLVVVVFSPVIVAIFLLGWWIEAAWRLVAGRND